MLLSLKEREREFWCERKYRGNTKRCLKECQRRVTNKKETPCKDVYLKTADRTPLWWVELEYTLHIALCSYSCVGVAAMARNRNNRRSPTSFPPSSSRKPHAGVLIEVASVIELSEASGRVAAGLFMVLWSIWSNHMEASCLSNLPSDHWYSSNWNGCAQLTEMPHINTTETQKRNPLTNLRGMFDPKL